MVLLHSHRRYPTVGSTLRQSCSVDRRASLSSDRAKLEGRTNDCALSRVGTSHSLGIQVTNTEYERLPPRIPASLVPRPLVPPAAGTSKGRSRRGRTIGRLIGCRADGMPERVVPPGGTLQLALLPTAPPSYSAVTSELKKVPDLPLGAPLLHLLSVACFALPAPKHTESAAEPQSCLSRKRY